METAAYLVLMGVMGALLTTTVPLLVMILLTLKNTAHQLNSRMDQLLEASGKVEYDRGREAGRGEDRS